MLYNPHQTAKGDENRPDIELPIYVGCYNDGLDGNHDLEYRIGDAYSVRDCFNDAKKLGYEYAGL